MKENLSRLRGYSFRTTRGDFTLREPCRQTQCSHDQLFFTTNTEHSVCKCIDLSSESSKLRFRHEKHIYEMIASCKNVVECAFSCQFEYRKLAFGLFLYVRVKPTVSLRDEMQGAMATEREVIAVLQSVLQMLEAVHQRNIAYLNVRPENVVPLAAEKAGNSGGSNGYCMINFDKAINKELTQQDARQNILLSSLLESTHKYVSPQMLNPFPKYLIGPASDIFNVGCLAFELCYKEYPFATPLAVINMQYKIPEKTGVGFPIVNEMIQKCFVEVGKRVKAGELLRWLASRQETGGMVNSPLLETKSQFTTTIFDQFKNALTKMTKESESWIICYTEDTDEQPEERFVSLLLVKVYKNRDKLNKIYPLIYKHTTLRLNSVVSMQKTLILLLNFLRKGPRQVTNTYTTSMKQIIDLISKKYPQNSDPLILQLTKLLNLKLQLTLKPNPPLFSGNFQLLKLPSIHLIDFPILESLLNYLTYLVSLCQRLQVYPFRSFQLMNFTYNNLCDEIYDLTVTLIMLYVCINKDVELGRRRPEGGERLGVVELGLEKVLRGIAKLQKVPKLHLIASLQGGMMTYKYAIDFEPTDNIQVSTFELFYQTGKIYNNLILPVGFVEGNSRMMREDFSSYGGNTKKSEATFMEEGEDSDEGERPRAQTEAVETNKHRKVSGDSSTNAIFENWNNSNTTATATTANISNPSISIKLQITQKVADVFPDFKPKPQQKQLTHNMDFEVLWSTRQPEKKTLNFDFFQMNSDGNNLNKKQSQQQVRQPVPVQVPQQPKMQSQHSNVEKKHMLTHSIHQRPQSYTSPQTPQLQQTTDKPQNPKPSLFNPNPPPKLEPKTFDLLDFGNSKQPQLKPRQSKTDKKQPLSPTFDFSLYSQPNQTKNTSMRSTSDTPPQPHQSHPPHPPHLHPQLSCSNNSSAAQLSYTQPLTRQTQSPLPRPLNLEFMSLSTSNTLRKQQTYNLTMSPLKPQHISQLENEICEDMKDDELRKLIKSSNIVIEFSKIEFTKVIGCGSTGEVYKGTYNGQLVAVKKIKVKSHSNNTFKEFQRELMTLIRIKKHQYLVSLIAISKKGDEYYLLIDYCEGGNLFELLHRRTDIEVPWKTRIKIAKQVAIAMNYLHNCQPQIIHRDLKSLNILIQKKYNPTDQNITIKVTDFGLSRNPDEQYMTSALGTLHWMAPELLQNKTYNFKVDVYSYAVVLWEICSRETPYKQFKSPLAIMKHVTIENGRPNLTRLNAGFPLEMKKLMVRCWGINEAQRPSFSEIINQLEALELTI